MTRSAVRYGWPSLRSIACIAVAVAVASGRSAQAAEVERPIWVAAWGNVEQPTRNVTSMVRLPGDFRPGQANESVNPEEIANQLKSRPEGRRVLTATW